MNSYAKTNVVSISRVMPVLESVNDLKFLYIPVNNLGMAVEPKKAVRLECWKFTGERRSILYVADSLKYAMVRKQDDTHVHLLSQSFSIDTDASIKWLTEIHRCVEGDIHVPSFQIVSPSV